MPNVGSLFIILVARRRIKLIVETSDNGASSLDQQSIESSVNALVSWIDAVMDMRELTNWLTPLTDTTIKCCNGYGWVANELPNTSNIFIESSKGWLTDANGLTF